MPEARALLGELERSTGPAFRRLNAAVAGLVDEWGLVSFAPLDYSDEESVGDVLAQARPGCRSAFCCVCVSVSVETRRICSRDGIYAVGRWRMYMLHPEQHTGTGAFVFLRLYT